MSRFAGLIYFKFFTLIFTFKAECLLMIRLKTPAEIEQLAAGGKIHAQILTAVMDRVKPGVTPAELDAYARELITNHGVTPSFLNYAPPGHTPYPAALCVSVNSEVVHGLPTTKPLEALDIVGLDLGIVYEGLYLDGAHTVIVAGDQVAADDERVRLLRVTTEALARGIAAAQPGNRIGDISAAIQEQVEKAGFSVVRQLVGHGVGYAVHEEPSVPNFGRAGRGPKLEPGLVIAIEPMVVTGDPAVDTLEDGWTVVTSDGGLAAHEEHTVAITNEGPRILTQV